MEETIIAAMAILAMPMAFAGYILGWKAARGEAPIRKKAVSAVDERTEALMKAIDEYGRE